MQLTGEGRLVFCDEVKDCCSPCREVGLETKARIGAWNAVSHAKHLIILHAGWLVSITIYIQASHLVHCSSLLPLWSLASAFIPFLAHGHGN